MLSWMEITFGQWVMRPLLSQVLFIFKDISKWCTELKIKRMPIESTILYLLH